MKIKSSNRFFHIIHWILVIIILVLVFGSSWGSKSAAFFFICMLLPIVMGTSYFFNFVLVPRYFLKKRYFRFGLYTFYTFVISLYLETIIIMFSLIYLGNFSFENIPPRASDTLLMAAVLYLLVFIASFLLMTKQIKEKQQIILDYELEKEKLNHPFLEIMSQRRMAKIPFKDIRYIESLADYVQVNTLDGEIVSKEKIGKLSDRLPETFLRIHRSFIVNKDHIKRFSYNEVEVGDSTLNIGRSYKKSVREVLQGTE
jgi:hypothetical protein